MDQTRPAQEITARPGVLRLTDDSGNTGVQKCSDKSSLKVSFCWQSDKRKLWVMIWNRSVYFWLMMTKPY